MAAPVVDEDWLAAIFLTKDLNRLRDAYNKLIPLIQNVYGSFMPPGQIRFYQRLADDPINRDLIHFVLLVATLFMREVRPFIIGHHKGNTDLFLNHLSNCFYALNDQKRGPDDKVLFPNYTFFLGEMRTFYLGNMREPVPTQAVPPPSEM